MNNRRRQIVINKSFQYKYTFINSLIASVAFLTLMVPILYILNNNYKLLINISAKVSPEILTSLRSEQMIINYSFIALFIVTSLVILIVNLHLSNKIAGPIYAFSKAVSELLLKKNYRYNLNLRKYDNIKELEPLFNTIREHFIHKEVEQIKILKEIQEGKSLVEDIIEKKVKKIGNIPA